MPLISVVVPMFNERHRLPAGLAAIARLRERVPGDCEVILVDDGSTDGTLQAARAAGARVLAEPHRGKGGALKAGVAVATGDRVLLADIDWSVDPAHVPAFLAVDADLVLATREGPGARRIAEPSWRHWLGRAFNLGVQQGLLGGHSDTQCGFKLLTREAARALFPRLTIDGWAYDVELLYLAHRAGFSVRELPVVWRYEADSRLRPVRDGVAMLRDVRRVRRNIRDGTYGP